MSGKEFIKSIRHLQISIEPRKVNGQKIVLKKAKYLACYESSRLLRDNINEIEYFEVLLESILFSIDYFLTSGPTK